MNWIKSDVMVDGCSFGCCLQGVRILCPIILGVGVKALTPAASGAGGVDSTYGCTPSGAAASGAVVGAAPASSLS